MKRILAHTILLVSVMQIQTLEAGAQATGDSRILDASLYREKLNPVHRPEFICFR
jgi:hypothetical protein